MPNFLWKQKSWFERLCIKCKTLINKLDPSQIPLPDSPSDLHADPNVINIDRLNRYNEALGRSSGIGSLPAPATTQTRSRSGILSSILKGTKSDFYNSICVLKCY